MVLKLQQTSMYNATSLIKFIITSGLNSTDMETLLVMMSCQVDQKLYLIIRTHTYMK